MRLHQLTMTAVGPFAEEQVVDFAKLATSGVFLLEGPTGVGKSTVLDSITFALYGGVASDSADPARMHSHFADPSVTPEVRLEFSVQRQRYRIVRSPQHDRPKKGNREGTTTQNASVAFYRLDDAGNSDLITKDNREAGGQIHELVGLNRSQFSKVVLLPQGEFSRFLEADDDVRRELLTSLFGARQYDKITELLAEEARQANARITEQKVSVAEERAAALEAAALSDEQIEEIKEVDLTKLAEKLKEITVELAGSVASAAAAVNSADREKQQAKDEATKANLQKERIEKVLRFARRQREFAQSAQRRNQDKTRLTAARKAVGPGRTLAALQAAKQKRAKAEGEAIEAAGGREELQRWSADPGGLKKRLEDVGNTAAGLGPAVAEEKALPTKKDELDQLQAKAAAAQEELKELNQQKEQLPELITAQKEQVAEQTKVADQVEVLQDSQTRINKQVSAAKEVAELRPKLVEAKEAQRAAIDHYQKARDDHQDLVQRRIAGMAAELAGELQSGEPCAVCGSTEHPQPAQSDDNAVTQQEIDTAETRLKRFEDEREQARKNVADLNEKLAAQKATAGDADSASLQEELTQVNAHLEQAQKAAAGLKKLREGLDKLNEQREQIAAEILECTGRERKFTTKVDSAQQELTDLEKRLAEFRRDFDTVAARKQDLETQRLKLDELLEAISALNTAAKQVQEQQSQFENDREQAGFDSLVELQDALLPEDELQELDDVVEKDDNEKAALEALAEDKDLQGIDPDSINADEVAAKAEEAAAALRKAEQGANEARSRFATAKARNEQFTKAVTRVEDSLTELNQVIAAAEPIQELASLAAGKKAALQGKMALTSYVLRQYLERVVIAANHRLTRIAGGKYELVQSDAVRRATDRTGLGLQVLDRHTNQERSPKTLSGGEKFYTSLALALGLADVVQAEAGGAALDTLFIDEGFGTLDPDVLEDVLEVIDGLRENGRSVGIVSHVTELKERVSERIEIRRPQVDGPASVEVIA
jgi:exonuclease SbcC